MSFLVAVNAALLLLALALLWASRRGRRVDDHPSCRRCGFDLFGLPSGSTNCSECGADVTRRGAVRTDHRARGRQLLAGGAVLMLLSGPPLAILGKSLLRP